MRDKRSGDYLIRLLDPQYRCIFCLKEAPVFSLEEKEVAYCCEIGERGVPLGWSARSDNYSFYVDWLDVSKCNSMFCSYIEVDLISRNV